MRLSTTRIAVFVLAGLIFLAALVLDTTALLELAAYWISRVPLAIWAVALIAIGAAVFATRRRRTPTRRKSSARTPARPRRQAARPGKRGQAASRRPVRRTRPAR